jgi:hypothetical protein
VAKIVHILIHVKFDYFLLEPGGMCDVLVLLSTILLALLHSVPF